MPSNSASVTMEPELPRTVCQVSLTRFPSAPSSAASTVDTRKGMGIGLSICKAIVNAHNGEITARNLTEGAEFCFTIPKEEIHHETYDPNPRH